MVSDVWSILLGSYLSSPFIIQIRKIRLVWVIYSKYIYTELQNIKKRLEKVLVVAADFSVSS
jgi:hypothetical protein